MAASEDTIREVATVAGWSYERMARVLANKSKASPMELAAAIAALENMIDEKGDRIGQRKKEIEEIEQQMIDLVHKATAGKINLPKGFHPLPFAAFLALYLPRLPMLGIDLAMIAEASSTRTEIGPGVAVIERLEREGVIMFTENASSGDPGLFIAPEKMFSNPADAAIADRMVHYFENTGEFSNEDGRIVGDKVNGEPVTVATWIAKASGSIQAISKELKISRRIVDETLYRMEARGFLAVKALDDGFGCHVLVSNVDVLTRTERTIVECITVLYGTNRGSFQNGRVKLGVPVAPAVKVPEHYAYMRARDMQYAALEGLEAAIPVARARGMMMANQISAADNWSIEVRILRKAATFCWLETPMRAVRKASQSPMLLNSRLEKDTTPGDAGWWWFDTELDITTTTNDKQIVALSWSWANINERGRDIFEGIEIAAPATGRGVVMSAYIMDGAVPMPSTEFFWSEGVPLSEMLVNVEKALRRTHAGDEGAIARLPMTMIACEHMARFFIAGCLWCEQKILVESTGHIERHERKRFEKEKGHVRPVSDVRIIQLRRKEIIRPAGATPINGEHHPREYSCNWVVDGHWKGQWYASKGYHKTIWIESYPAGPPDKPFRQSPKKIIAVKR